MVKFVPVTDVERPKDAQNLNTSANEKHRKFDNPHTVKKTVDRGWQQGNVGWGVLGAFGNSDKDDAAQVIKRAEGVNKMVKNEKGLWVKVKDLSDAGSNITSYSSSMGRGGGISVLDSLAASTSSSYEKDRRGDQDDIRSAGRSDSRFRDDSKDRYHRSKCDSDRRVRSRSRSRDSREDRSRERKHWSDDRHEISPVDRRSYRTSSHSHHRGRDGNRSRSRSHSNHRKEKSRSHQDRDQSSGNSRRHRDDDRGGKGHRSSRADRDEDMKMNQLPSRHADNNGDKYCNDSKVKDFSSSSSRNITRDSSNHGGDKERDTNNSKKEVKSAIDSDDGEEDNEPFVFDFTAIQLANRFLEVFSGENCPPILNKKNNMKCEEDDDDDEDEDEKERKKLINLRLESIASLFTEDACVLSLKSGKAMLNGRKVIRDSFSRTLPDYSKCTYRIVVDTENLIKNNITNSSTNNLDDVQITVDNENKSQNKNENKHKNENEMKNESENENGGGVSYCLDFYGPNMSPGLGDRKKDTALLYRCVGSLLTHIWGAVDPDKLSSSFTENEVKNSQIVNGKNTTIQMKKITKNIVLNSKCWNWAEIIIKNDFPSLPVCSENNSNNSEHLIFHDYNNIESW